MESKEVSGHVDVYIKVTHICLTIITKIHPNLDTLVTFSIIIYYLGSQ